VASLGSPRWIITRRSAVEVNDATSPGVPSTPEMSIESLDHNKAVSYLGIDGDEESWSQFDDYHRAALQRLEASGIDFALMASNTPHDRYATIVRGIGIPVSIFEVVAQESARMGAREVLILGTATTMRSSRCREEFAKYGVEAAGPQDETVRTMTVRLIAELQLGKVDRAPEWLGRIVRSAAAPEFTRRLVVCLACTELALAFPGQKMLANFECDGVLYVNSAAVHINAVFDFAVGGD